MSDNVYKSAGVDIEAGSNAVEAIRQAVESTHTSEVIGSIGGFGGLYRAAALLDMDDPILVSGTDGVGTKLELAQRTHRLATVGIDLVAMCVNDIICCGAKPLFFLDYVALGKLDPALVTQLVEGVAAGCKEAGCALVGGEMAEHPGTMNPEDFDLSGFCVGVVDRPKMIGPSLVQEGDAIIGISSSGLHSNGYSLVRHTLTNTLSDEELLHAQLADESLLIDALLAPTRLYAKPLLTALEAGLPIHATAHITGGGITFNLNRVLPVGFDAEVCWGSWTVPSIINYLVNMAKLKKEEALKTFNMGIGLAVVCEKNSVDAILAHFQDYGTSLNEQPYASCIGAIVKAPSKKDAGKVVYKGLFS